MNGKLALALFALILFTVNPLQAQQGDYRLGQVIGLRYATLTQGEPDGFKQFVVENEYPFWDTHTPGSEIVVMHSDRGTRDGAYAVFFNFDSLARRNYYFPTPEAPWPNFDTINEKWGNEVGSGGYELDVKGQGDYVLVGSETVKDMPWINMLGIHHIKVKPGMHAAFDEFVEHEWNPHSHLPGWWVLVYKSDRGPRMGEYLLVHALEPGLLRDIYFPGGGEGLSEAGMAAYRPVQSQWEALQRISFLQRKAKENGPTSL